MPQLPGLVELDAGSGGVRLDHTALPRAAERIVFGRGLGGRVVSEAVVRLVDPSRAAVLLVVGESSSNAPEIAALLNRLRRLADHGTAALRAEVLKVRGHADHDAIRAGIAAVRRSGASLVVAIGGGTTIDVAKSVAALARQGDEEDAGVAVNVDVDADVDADVDVDVAAFHLGRRHVAVEKALLWVAVPTTSGTGSESTDNAVIEIGDEKKSLRGIPPARLIVADPALTDSLPLAPTVVAAVDALAQALEVLTCAGASPEVQEVALAAFATLARGIEDLYLLTRSNSLPLLAASAAEVADTTRDTLCWGSLLMGIAFAHARLGLPHALVHFCNRFGLSHGNMVGMLLAPGLAVQARDPETARRLARAAQALDAVLRCGDVPAPEGPAPESRISETSVPGGSELLFRWLETRIPALLAATGLPHSLRAAGLTRADLDWIVAREMDGRPSFGTPARPATPGELKKVLEGAYGVDG
ncbi:MAG: iron-containing alcohol dehydrogenase [Bacteroidota bacterium]